MEHLFLGCGGMRVPEVSGMGRVFIEELLLFWAMGVEERPGTSTENSLEDCGVRENLFSSYIKISLHDGV